MNPADIHMEGVCNSACAGGVHGFLMYSTAPRSVSLAAIREDLMYSWLESRISDWMELVDVQDAVDAPTLAETTQRWGPPNVEIGAWDIPPDHPAERALLVLAREWELPEQ